jgi:aryl-alcohol dehydrogenase-like predicted oxidoreductase
MTFGTEWGWGADRDESRRVFDAYIERGGNFIDTADIYTGGTSETFVGEFIGDRREQLVIATKYSNNTRQGDPNAGGNHRKNMVQSVENSLRRLKTDYIDLYWVHLWEYRTPVEEVMRALDDLVRAGKILYVGISDAPAWKVSQANTIASLRGWTPFIALQVEYNLIERTPERELIPMAQELGLTTMPWSPLAGGILTGKYRREDAGNGNGAAERGEMVNSRLTDNNFAIAEAVEQVAGEIGKSPSQVALNWLLSRPFPTIPILGARTLKHLEDNLGCLEFTLSDTQRHRLDEVSKIALGFPHDFLASDQVLQIRDGGAQIETREAILQRV